MAHNVLDGLGLLADAMGAFDPHCARGIEPNLDNIAAHLAANPYAGYGAEPTYRLRQRRAIAKAALAGARRCGRRRWSRGWSARRISTPGSIRGRWRRRVSRQAPRNRSACAAVIASEAKQSMSPLPSLLRSITAGLDGFAPFAMTSGARARINYPASHRLSPVLRQRKCNAKLLTTAAASTISRLDR